MEIWALLVLAASFSPGLAKAPIASGVCPKGYFRNATVLFPCDKRSGTAYAPLSKTEEVVIRVPTGVQDLKLKVHAKFPMMIAYRDPLDAKEIPFVRDAEKTDDWKGLAMQMDAGQVISEQTGVWSGIWRVGLNFIGTSQAELDVLVQGAPEGGRHELSDISFEYAAYSGCSKPTVPMGCSDFARFASRQLVFNWSSWVQETYPSADEAWRELCDKTMSKVASLEEGPVPYYMFGEVWGKWPLANKVHPGWREAFRFFDTLGGTPPDGYVDAVEFRTGYGLASTYLSMFGWCEVLRQQYGSSKDAWKALSGAEFGMASPVDFKKWEDSFWSTYKPEEGMSKATADESFVYADADGNEVVSEKEFASIYFSCAPENQGRPPGGQAAEAEKEEEAAKEAKKDTAGTNAANEGATTPADEATRCLYEDIEYSGKEAGAASHTQNVTQCQVRCRESLGCAHFSFRQRDGRCTLWRMDALWLTQSGAVSGPARCVAQVRLMLKNLDLAKLETQKDILQVEIAMELAKASDIPVRDIRDLQGQVGKVSISADPSEKGQLVMDSFVDIPAGVKLQEVEKLAARSGANEKLREALEADTSSVAAGMQVFVEAIPYAQCFVLGTKLQPNMADLATALTARACQSMCQRTPKCAFFSYLKDSQECGLHTADAKPIFFEAAIAGPKVCQGLPSVYEPSAEEMEVAASGGSIFTNAWFWIILLLVIAALVAALCWLRRSRLFSKKSKGRQVSRQQDGKLAEHRYMPLPADQQLEQDMVSQAASDAAWQQQQLGYHGLQPAASHGPASHGQSQTPSDVSPMSGRGTWNGNGSYGNGSYGNGSYGNGSYGGSYGSQWSQPQHLPPPPQMTQVPSQSQQIPVGGWQGTAPPWNTQADDWMPHFLGAEAVKEYDAWRAQRQRIQPQLQENYGFPHAYSLPAQSGPVQTQLGQLGSQSFRSELRSDPRVT